jgi:hypothetical protein
MEANRKGNSSDGWISIKRFGINIWSEDGVEEFSTMYRKNSMVEASGESFNKENCFIIAMLRERGLIKSILTF